MTNQTINNIKNSDPMKLLEWLEENYTHRLPVGIQNANDLNEAGKMLGKLSNEYAYIMALQVHVNLLARLAKAECPPKPKASDTHLLEDYQKKKNEYDAMMMRKNILESFCEILKSQYSAVSRMIAVYQQEQNELYMTDSRKQREGR